MAVQMERRTIDVIPDAERHGTPRDQFTLWFGANMQITAIVDGALAVVFGADALWAIIGLLIGNICGGVVMALHSAQGPRMGIPQMISSRAQFGVLGACLSAGTRGVDVPRVRRHRHGAVGAGDRARFSTSRADPSASLSSVC